MNNIVSFDRMAWQRGFFIGFAGMAALNTCGSENHLVFLDRMLPKMKQPQMSKEERDWAEAELKRILPHIMALIGQNKESG